MASIKITLDKRESNKTNDGKYALVLQLGHQRKTRYIPFDIHLKEDQYDHITGKITGILNSVRQTKRTQKLLSEVDLWIDENAEMIKLWPIEKLKLEIERQFFNKQSALSMLGFGGRYLHRLATEGRYSTASSYEDALKAFIKYRMRLAGKPDDETIKTLYNRKDNQGEGFEILPEYKKYDMAIKAIDAEFMKDFKAYMTRRYKSRNTVGIYLRSLNAILNDAGQSFPELKDHTPLAGVKKASYENTPNPLTPDEINLIRKLDLKPDSPDFHARNFFLFMFNNMGMNFYDMALIKVMQFDGERIKYFRKKTMHEGDFFSIKQSAESLAIIDTYNKSKKKPEDYLFPIMPMDTPPHRMHRVKNDKIKWFNKRMKLIAQQAGIAKTITSYSARDTWTNIGLDMGIDIRQISSALGHSSVSVTDKHYGKVIIEKLLDEVNSKVITMK